MKIVVGGASNVGKSIVGYLSFGNNDIVVIDEDGAKLDEIAKFSNYTVKPMVLSPEGVLTAEEVKPTPAPKRRFR